MAKCNGIKNTAPDFCVSTTGKVRNRSLPLPARGAERLQKFQVIIRDVFERLADRCQIEFKAAGRMERFNGVMTGLFQ
jgi:hypothetical protein